MNPQIVEREYSLYERCLKEKLIKKGYAETSINLWMNQVKRLLPDRHFSSAHHMKNAYAMVATIEAVQSNSVISQWNAIMAVIKLLEQSPESAQKTHAMEVYDNWKDEHFQYYQNNQRRGKIREDTDWEWVTARVAALKTAIQTQNPRKLYGQNKILCWIVATLYTKLPPARNQDYSKMKVIECVKDATDPEMNYWVRGENKMIFRIYKTAQRYGEQQVDVPDDLTTELELWWAEQHRDPVAGNYLLVPFDGGCLRDKDINRFLNKAFKKGVGCSMLRRLQLEKYRVAREKMEKDAVLMRNSVSVQRIYHKVEF